MTTSQRAGRCTFAEGGPPNPPLFFLFFWVTGELPILRQQEAAADARRT